ncbi:MAG: RNA polymerase sigma factor [Chloroflexi bacterium]|nr:MAG: RNA polymerase sigma factor [Chloroflexota bacterium]
MWVLRGVPERRETMLYAQPRQNSTLRGRGVPDGVLVGQAQVGDQRAFELLMSRYHRLLASYIRGFLKDGDQVSDVLQQVYLQLYLSLPILLTNVSLKGWLLQVARNRCLDELRRRRRQAAVPFSALEWEYGEEEQTKIQATDLYRDRAHARHASVDRQDLLLPLAAAVAQDIGRRHTLCNRLVV